MERETSPLAVFLEYSEEIYLLLEDTQIAIIGGIVFVLTFAFSVINDTFFHTEYFSGLVYFLKIISLIFVLGNGIPVFKRLNKWGTNFFKSSYVLKFEMLPAIGNTSQEQLLNKTLEVFIDVDARLKEFDWNMIKKNFINVNVNGKKTSHLFDVFIGKMKSSEYSEEERKMMKSLEGTKYIAAKEFTQKEPITSKDIENFKNEILDSFRVPFYLRFFTADIQFNRIILVSNSTFTPDCINYVKNRRNRLRQTGFDLIIKKDNRYNVLFIA